MKTICHEHNIAFDIPDINICVPDSGGSKLPENSPQLAENPKQILPLDQIETLISKSPSPPLRTISRDSATTLSPPYHHERLRKSRTHGNLRTLGLLFEEL